MTAPTGTKPGITLLLACTLLFGCGLREKANQIKEMAEAAEERLAEGDTAGALGAFFGGGEPVQPVDFRVLKDLLPDQLDGMTRENASGEKSGIAGLSTSKAEGAYRADDGNGRIQLSVMDFGSVRGITMMGFSWAMVDIDNQSDSGYERTVKYEGYPAYVKYEQADDGSRGQMSAIIVDRFVITAEGNNVSDARIRSALETIDLNRLESMKDAGVGETAPEAPDIADFKPQLPDSRRDEQQRRSDAGSGAESETETMTDVLADMNDGQNIDPIDFRELRAMLPDEAAGMPRANAEGQKGGTAGIVQSSVTGTYQVEGERNRRIVIKITDLGNLRGAMMMGGYPWLIMQVDKESDTGFERTTTYEGFPTFESYSTKGRVSNGKIQTIVGRRFTVEVEGRGVEWEAIRSSMDHVDVKALEARKDEGITPAG